jgi:IS30 family transposase
MTDTAVPKVPATVLPMPEVTFAGLHHVQLAIPPGTEQQAREFYSGVLGMTELQKPPVLASRGGCWFRAGGWEIHLGVESPFMPARKAHPGVLVQRIDSLAARLEAAGVAAAWDRAARPKPCKLALNPALREHVVVGLGLQWSPEQIAGWLPVEFPDDPELRVSYETIYLSLFVQSKGLLSKELTKELRSGRGVRRAGRISVRGQGRGQIVDALHISERPAEADDRAVPGHWEGDMVSGSGNSHVGTLVERSSRFVQLVKLENKTTDCVIAALTAKVQELPEQLKQSLTWDRGLEMAKHKQFTVDTGVQVYFCDLKSPGSAGPTRTPTACFVSTCRTG